MRVSKTKSMLDLNMLASTRTSLATRKINKLYARVDDDGVARAGTPYPYATAVGRNLIRNADFKDETTNDGIGWIVGSGVGNKVTVSYPTVDGKKAMTVVSEKKSDGYQTLYIQNVFDNVYLDGKQKVTISFKVKSIDPITTNKIERVYISLGRNNTSSNVIIAESVDLTKETTEEPLEEPTKELKEFSFSVETSLEYINRIEFRLGSGNDIQNIAIQDVKLELGNKTDFTIAPEDGGPAASESKARDGLLFEDISFKDEQRVVSSILIGGAVLEDRLPVKILAASKKQLKKIKFL